MRNTQGFPPDPHCAEFFVGDTCCSTSVHAILITAEHKDLTIFKRCDILRRDSVVFYHVIQHLLFSIFLCPT